MCVGKSDRDDLLKLQELTETILGSILAFVV